MGNSSLLTWKTCKERRKSCGLQLGIEITNIISILFVVISILCRISCAYSVWATIALVHFLQYVRCDVASARRILIWATKRREILPSQKEEKEEKDEDDDEEDNEEEDKKASHSEGKKGSDCAVCISYAYVFFDRADLRSAITYTRTALEYDPQCNFAIRALALFLWYQGHKQQAITLFEKAVNLNQINPYLYRSYAIVLALDDKYDQAIKFLQQAVEISPNSCPLSWRALGVLQYTYGSEKVKPACLTHFDMAFELSQDTDYEAYRLKAQVLMDMGRYEEAIVALRKVLPLNPCDPIGLASLAICLGASGFTPPTGLDKVNYSLKIQIMDSPLELTESNDPLELFEASIIKDLAVKFRERAKNAGKNKYNNTLSKGWGIVNDAVEPTDTVNDFHTDVPPVVLYWYL
jgi:tetratricopeptide (TPR) repeat protein